MGPRRAEAVAGRVPRTVGSGCHGEEKASRAHVMDPWEASCDVAVGATPAPVPVLSGLRFHAAGHQEPRFLSMGSVRRVQFMRPWSIRQYLLPKLAFQQDSIRGLQFLQLPIELQDAMMILGLTAQDKIDLQTTILSRFDLIFIVNDIRMCDQDKTREVAARISVGGAGPRRLGRQCGLEKRWRGRQCWSERRGPRKRWRGRMRPRWWRLPSPSTTTCSSPSSCHRTAGAHERDTGPIQLRCDCMNLFSLVWKKLERTMNLHLPCLCLASSVPVIDGHGNAAVQARLQFQIAEISRLSKLLAISLEERLLGRYGLPAERLWISVF